MPTKFIGTLCRKPYMQGVLAHGCGQCMPCRISRRRIWAHRLLLESYAHGDSSFITLTYEGLLPTATTLIPKHYQDWLKRLRKAVAPKKLRYFIVGEYGEENQRAHFHAALYGYPPCPNGNYKYCPLKNCTSCRLIEKTWGHGNVSVGDLSLDSAQYVAGYVTKKMTHPESDCTGKCKHPPLLGRHPEFAKMSLDGGIGIKALPQLMDTLTSDEGSYLIQAQGDVPRALSHGRKSLPLGRYLRSKLRQYYGFKENIFTQSRTPKTTLQKHEAEMLGMFRELKDDPQNKGKSLRNILVDSNNQRVLNVETRFKISKRKPL